MVGVILILARLLRLGFLANFLSRAVLIGFLTGVGIQVAMGQLAGVLGVSDGSGTTIQKFVTTLQNIPETNIWDLAISIARLGPHPRLRADQPPHPGRPHRGRPDDRPRVPRASTRARCRCSAPCPRACRRWACRRASSTRRTSSLLLPTALSCFIIILAQSAATSRAYAAKYEDSFNENVDLVGLSMANLGAGLSGTFVVNGSPTKTQMVDGAGGKTQLSQLVAGGFVALVLLFLTPAPWPTCRAPSWPRSSCSSASSSSTSRACAASPGSARASSWSPS